MQLTIPIHQTLITINQTLLIELHKKGKLKGKSETVKQIKKGHFDKGPIGSVTKTVAMGLSLLFNPKKVVKEK